MCCNAMDYFASYVIVFFCIVAAQFVQASLENDISNESERFKIEGTVLRPDISLGTDANWFANTKIFTNTGFFAFLRENGSFVIHNVPWGSHVVNVMNPSILFEPIRVDISSKGKQRARVVNHIQPSKVDLVQYPLKFKAVGPYKYFQVREQWRITDLLFNPMVMMTILPLAMMMLLPRLSDADTRKEMESQLQMPKVETPELSEFMTNLFKGSSGASSSSSSAVHRSQRSVMGARSGRRKDK